MPLVKTAIGQFEQVTGETAYAATEKIAIRHPFISSSIAVRTSAARDEHCRGSRIIATAKDSSMSTGKKKAFFVLQKFYEQIEHRSFK